MRFLFTALVLLASPAWAQSSDPPALEPGGWIESALTAADPVLTDSSIFKGYTLVSDGSPFEIRLHSSQFDPYLILRAPSGEQYDNDDFQGAWEESRVEIGADQAETGTWTVVATTYTPGDTGRFVLAHRPVPRQLEPGTLPPGGWVGDALAVSDVLRSDSSYVDLYSLQSDGSPFEVRLLASAFDSYLALRSPSGELLGNDDYDGSRRESRVVVAAPEPGEWMVAANSYAGGETGEYALTHRQLEAAEAAAVLREATEQVRDTTLARAASLSGQAVVLYAEGRYADGLPLAQEALALRRATLGADHPDVAASLLTLGRLLQASGETQAARDTLARAVVTYETAAGATNPGLSSYTDALGRAAFETGDLELAAASFERTLDLLEPREEIAMESGPYRFYSQANLTRLSASAERGKGVAATLYNLAQLRAAQDSTAAAERLYQEALTIEEAALGPDHPDVAVTLLALGQLRQGSGDLDSARTVYDRALRIQEAALGPDDPNLIRTLVALARLAVEQGQHAEARATYDRALALLEKTSGDDHPETAAVVNAIGELVQLEAFEAARPLYERALASLEVSLGADHETTVRTRNNLDRLQAAEEGLRTNAPPARLRGGPDVEPQTVQPTRAGLDRAILFATDVYDDPAFARLANPIADAEAVARELRDRYGFDTTLVRNPTRQQIYDTLEDAANVGVPENSQLVVFFAGHGTLNKGRGFVIPRDARADKRSTWFSYAALSEELDLVPDHRVLLLLDVCQGGSFIKRYRGGDEYQKASPQELMAKSAPYRARLAITSGGEEYVSDGSPGDHSPFAYYLLEALRSPGGPDGDGLLVFDELVGYVRAVRYATPMTGGFQSHDPGGTFFFYDADAAVAPPE